MKELSLFSGAGGGLLGTKLLGWEHCGYIEFDDYCQRVIAQRIDDGFLDEAPIFSDIKAFISDGYAESYQGMVDVVTGGFPCQPFSVAAGEKRKADEDPRHLFPSILNVIQDTQPRVVFLENVEGIISAKLKGDEWSDPAGTPVLLHVCRELERRGYKTAWGIFSAEEIGAPMQRKRVFICGMANAISPRPQRWLPAREDSERQGEHGHAGRSSKCVPTRWPARPGTCQNEWEEPRVVANANSRRLAKKPGNNGQVPEVQEDQGQELDCQEEIGTQMDTRYMGRAGDEDDREHHHHAVWPSSKGENYQTIASRPEMECPGGPGGTRDSEETNAQDRQRRAGVPKTTTTSLGEVLGTNRLVPVGLGVGGTVVGVASEAALAGDGLCSFGILGGADTVPINTREAAVALHLAQLACPLVCLASPLGVELLVLFCSTHAAWHERALEHPSRVDLVSGQKLAKLDAAACLAGRTLFVAVG